MHKNQISFKKSLRRLTSRGKKSSSTEKSEVSGYQSWSGSDEKEPVFIRKKSLKTLEQMPHKQQYLEIIYRSMIYVRKFALRTTNDDGILLEEVIPHVSCNMSPKPKTELGVKLLCNGYFCVALCILVSRMAESEYTLGAMLNSLAHQNNITAHKEEFEYYRKLPLKDFWIRGKPGKGRRGKWMIIINTNYYKIWMILIIILLFIPHKDS